jgi:DNA (cytosine-5)-methyltransferase 1
VRVLELFAGIGGCAVALGDRADVVAVDQDEHAHRVYTANFAHPAHRWNLAVVKAERLAKLEADLWWMSPPCQPFTVRGLGRDVDDPRCASFLRVMDLVGELRPPALALENVPLFAGSRAHARLRATLARAGYDVRERLLCPSDLGVPNERRRFYLIASRAPLPAPAPDPRAPSRLADHLDPDPDDALYVPEDQQRRYEGALAIVDARDPDAVTHCYTAAYGRSPVYSGSYVRDARGVRRLSPHEILRLLGFPRGFALPVPTPKAYKLAGNSLSVLAVRAVLAPLTR